MNNDLSNVSYKVIFKKVMERLEKICETMDKEEGRKRWKETLKNVEAEFFRSKYRPRISELCRKYFQ